MNHDIVLEVLGACDKRREERRAFMKNAGLAVAGATVLAACSNNGKGYGSVVTPTPSPTPSPTRPDPAIRMCVLNFAQPRVSRSAILFLRSQRHLDPRSACSPAFGCARRAEAEGVR